MSSADPLEFSDTKPYTVRLEAAQKKTGLTDAIRVGSGTMHGQPVVIACMVFPSLEEHGICGGRKDCTRH